MNRWSGVSRGNRYWSSWKKLTGKGPASVSSQRQPFNAHPSLN